MNITTDQWIAILQFVAGVLGLLATMAFVPANLQPFIVFGVAVINLALGTFFGVKQPIWKALHTEPPKDK